MDPPETLVKKPYVHVSIPRAHLRPELEQQLRAAPSSPEPPGRPCALASMEEVPGPKGAQGAALVQGQQAWQNPCSPRGGWQRPEGLAYAGPPPVGRGDDIAHHCCCCPCCRCCHCPPFCRCHSCGCVVS